MTILITGGAGFIGSNFIQYMLRKHPEYRIVNVDKLTYAGNLENLEEVEDDPRYSFHEGDICDRPFIVELLHKYRIETLVNFAAESHVDRSIHGASEFVRTNIVGTNVLLEIAKEHKLKKFIQVSTDEVYGSLGAEGKFTETTPIHPNSPYAASKASADMLVLAYHHTFGLPVVITRCSNNYGPYQFPEKLIPLMIANALSDKPLPVYGDGMNVRDWIHVADHCTAIDAVLHHGAIGQVYNIGGNSERANLDLVKLILHHLAKPESLITFVKDRPGHDRRYAIDSSKIQKELGWKPQYSFEQGLKETIGWYQKHQSWWKRILSGEYQQYYKKMYEGR
ncbi:MAG: dTDP-glucose 4,6-dehydratase [Ignavibacteriales bacterium]|nr:dTDP-glucose 4,6-dehydratase [Ignavibacteriales bacterium]